jgi:enoyl-[acyl-carrier-protein] reductase (NADH)
MGFLAGKKALIVGLATDRSIAWGISQSMRREGASRTASSSSPESSARAS